jgi:hypothetical protein
LRERGCLRSGLEQRAAFRAEFIERVSHDVVSVGSALFIHEIADIRISGPVGLTPGSIQG